MSSAEIPPAGGVLYRERTNFRLMQILTAFFVAIAVTMVGLTAYNFGVKPLDKDPSVGWVFPFEGALFGGLSVLMYSLRIMEILLTYDGVSIRIGPFRKTMMWGDIESFSLVDKGIALASGGVHFGPARGGWAAEYGVPGKPRIVVNLRGSGFKQVAFSTSNPQEVIRVMQSRLGKEAFREK